MAAGDGTRLAPLTFNRPKPLIPILGRPLLDYTLDAFVVAGITELVLVVGYKGEMIREWVGDGRRYGVRVEYISNHKYELENAVSLHAARSAVGEEPFLLAMADHIISPQILTPLLATEDNHDTLCVDRLAHTPSQVDDATKVWVNEGGFITHIGKGIEVWNAIDAGVFRLTPAIFAAIDNLFLSGKESPTLSDAVTWLIEKGEGMRACDVSGAFWMDVDTLEDLRHAERALQEFQR